MSLRRFAVPSLAVAVLACQASIPSQSPPETIAFAVSFPDSSDGTQAFQPPIPNDLVLQAATSASPPTVPAAQLALLKAFATAGGFPNDQEVPIQIQFFAVKPDAAGGSPTAAPFPDIDTTTITTSTLAVVRVDSGTPTPVEFEVAPTDYSATTGVLTIHKKVDPATGARWWATGPGGGRYVVALRGGDKGVKTKAGQAIAAQVSTLLISQDKDLTRTENQGLLATQPNPAAAAARLEAIRQLYATPQTWQNTPLGWNPPPGAGGPIAALAAVDAAFPHKEVASIQTFVVDPSAHVAIDPTSGIVPLPSSLLMKATPPNSYFTAAGGDPFASKVSVPTTGAFAALAPGLNVLDGFGTTPMLLIPTSGTPVQAKTVTSSSVVLLERLAGTNTWTKVPDFPTDPANGKYLTLPPPITVEPATGAPCTQPYSDTCVAKLIGLQPAVVVPVTGGNAVTLPPLKDHTEYAVIVTSDVKDAAGNPITAGTIQKILALAAPAALGGQGIPIVSNPTANPPGGTSLLAGVSDASAAQLQGLAPLVFNELGLTGASSDPARVVVGAAGAGVDPTKIVTAYTFVTQTIVTQATGVAALAAAVPRALAGATSISPAATTRKWGLPTAIAAANVDHFVEATLNTTDALDPQSGAFLSNPASAAPTPTNIPVLVSIPSTPAPAGGYPVAIVRHGLGRTRGDMINIAAALASPATAPAGGPFVAVAIDAAKFGDRAWCTTDADCATGATCDHTPFGNQGDAANAKPGLCTGGNLARAPLKTGIASCATPTATDCWDGTGGISKSSGAFFVSANLFRLRDSMRQDIIDEASLAVAMQNAATATALGVTLNTTGGANGLSYVGQSLGSINGVVDVASSPALFRNAVFNAGGGTFPDIAVDSPTLQPLLNGVLAAQGIQPGTNAFLQFVQVAKWIIDPADPVNFAATLVGNNTPVLGQAARCDNTVPNKENELLYGLLGKTVTNAPPTVLNPTATAANATMQWYMLDSSTACPTDGTTGQGATHGFLFDFSNVSLTTKAQSNAVTFLLTGAGATTPVVP